MTFAQFIIIPKPNILQQVFNESLPYKKKCKIRKKLRNFNYTAF